MSAWSPPTLVRQAAGEPEGAIVLLHGRGSDEHDLQPVIEHFDPERRLVGVTPRAPLSLPPGGFHWYVVPRVGFPDPATFMQSHERLTSWLDALPEQTGVPWERTVIGGFSQGTVMAYAAALASGRPSPAGILAFSGFIPTVPDFEIAPEGRSGLPVAIVHGILDPVIGVQFGRDARARLEHAGLPVTYRETAVDHRIERGTIEDLRPWLAGVLSCSGAQHGG